MYLKTPKKFTGRQRRSIIPWKQLFLVGITVGIVASGVYILQNQQRLQRDVETIALQVSDSVGQSVATLGAPPPTPTQDPQNDIISGDNAWAIGNTTDAVRNYQASLDAVPNNVGLHNRVAMGLIASGNTQEAITYAAKAVLSDPYSSDAWAIRSWAYSDNGDTSEAISDALHARALDPTNTRALAFLARALFSDGQTSRAETTVEDALVTDPESFEAYWVRAQIKEQGLYDFVGAVEDYQTAYAIASETMPTMAGAIAVDIARMQLRDADFDTAIATLEAARQMNAENTLVLFWLGRIYYSDLGDPNQALTYLQQCVDYNPNSYNCYYLLGRAQLSLDQVGAATLSLERATELNSPYERHWWWAANIHFQQGDCGKAEPFLRQGYTLINDLTPQDLLDAYDYLISTCSLNIGRPQQLATPTPDPAVEETPEAASA